MRLAYLCGWSAVSFWKDIINGISDFCRINNTEIIIFPVESDEEGKDNKYFSIIKHHIKSGYIDGLIISPDVLPGKKKTGLNTFRLRKVIGNIPSLGLSIKLPGFPMVSIENENGVKSMMAHLINQHKKSRILFINHRIGQYESTLRLKAYKDSLRTAGIAVDHRLIRKGGIERRDGLMSIRDVLDKQISFDAVMCHNDETAIGVMEGLEEAGIQVPDEISVCGFDNSDISETIIPPLTTISQPGYELGLRAASILHSFLTQKISMKDSVIPARQIIRQSCGCLPREEQNEILKQNTKIDFISRNKKHTVDYLKEQMLKWIKDLQIDKASITAEILSGLYSSLLEDLNTGTELFLDQFNRLLITQAVRGEFISVWKRILPLMIELSRHSNQVQKYSNERASQILRKTQLILLEWQIINSSSNTTQEEFLQHKTQQFQNNILHIDNKDDFKKCLIKYLPLLGIQNMCIVLYDHPCKNNPGSLFPEKGNLWFVLQNGHPYPVSISDDFYIERLFPPHYQRKENDFDYFLISLARNGDYRGYCLLQKEEKIPLSTLFSIKDYLQYAVEKIDLKLTRSAK